LEQSIQMLAEVWVEEEALVVALDQVVPIDF
jgi:hypothetical protein